VLALLKKLLHEEFVLLHEMGNHQALLVLVLLHHIEPVTQLEHLVLDQVDGTSTLLLIKCAVVQVSV